MCRGVDAQLDTWLLHLQDATATYGEAQGQAIRAAVLSSRLGRLQQHPREGGGTVVLVEAQRRRHRVVVDLVVDVEVGDEPAPRDALVVVAREDGAHLPADRAPVEEDRAADEHAGALLTADGTDDEPRSVSNTAEYSEYLKGSVYSDLNTLTALVFKV